MSDNSSPEQAPTRRELRAQTKAQEIVKPVPTDGTALISMEYAQPPATPPTDDVAVQTDTSAHTATPATGGVAVAAPPTTGAPTNLTPPSPLSVGDQPKRKRGSRTTANRGSARAGAAIGALIVGVAAVTTYLATSPNDLPLTFISGPANGSETHAADASFTVSASNSKQLQCKLDSGNWYECDPDIYFSDLTDGTHTLQVKSLTSASETPIVTRSWTVNSSAAAASFEDGPQAGATTWTQPVNYTLAKDTPETKLSCRIDEEDWQPCTTSLQVDGLSPGKHIISVRGESPKVGTTTTTRTLVVADETISAEKNPVIPLNPTGQDAMDGIVGNADRGADKPAHTPKPQPTQKPTVDAAQPGQPTKPAQPKKPAQPAQPAQGGGTKYGVPPGTSLRVHQGDLTITKAGTHISGVDVRGFVRIKAPNVTFENSIVRGDTKQKRSIAMIASEHPGVRIKNVTLSPVKQSVYIDGIKGYGFTASNMLIKNVVDSVLIFGSNSAVKNSYLHSNAHFASDPHQGGGASHDDGVQVEGGKNITISGNRIEGAFNAAIQVTQNRGKTENLKITNNYLSGGGCTINISEKGKGSLPGLVIGDNKFGTSREHKCGIVSPPSTVPKAWGNTYAANGEPVRIRRGT